MTPAFLGQLVTVTTSVLLAALALYAVLHLRYRVPGTGYFVALCLAGAVWSAGYAFEKSQTTAEGFLLAARIEYLGLAFVPILWLLVALHWMDHRWSRSGVFKAALLAVGGLVVLAVATNEAHGWWYSSIEPTRVVGFAHYGKGPLYYPYFLFGLATFITSTVLILRTSPSLERFRLKRGIILLTNAVPVVFMVAFQLGFRPWGLDPTVFSLVPAFGAVAWGLFRHDLIRIVPIAREAVLDSMDQAVLVLDAQQRLVDRNKAALPLLPLLEVTMGQFRSPRGEVFLDLPEGRRIFRFRRSPIKGIWGEARGSVILLTDVTEERRLLEELAHQATHDPLTGAANRRHLQDHGLAETLRARRHSGLLSVVLFDLDYFKKVNDREGHQAGDEVLKHTVALVQSHLRPYDLLARFGGEEFVVLMPEVGLDEARGAAERWRRALETTPCVYQGRSIAVTASFGTAALPPSDASGDEDGRALLDQLLNVADKALYAAKAGGRNRVC